jgi:hypothetical protein
MTLVDNDKFPWDRLLDHIEMKKVIPVIGKGLYRLETDPSGENEPFLYDFLTERVLDACGSSVKPAVSHRFEKACFEFLKKNNYYHPGLSKFLKKTLEGVHLIHPNPLWKLTRIKNFNLFINTTRDNLLTNTIKTVRRIPTNTLYYTKGNKKAGIITGDLYDCLESSACTLVYQLFGNINKIFSPAFTEKDIMEALIEFHRDMVSAPQNNELFLKLKSSSLLFIGCEFDDWLFRFLIHILAEESKQFPKFTVDNFANNDGLFRELPQFLENNGVGIFCSSGDTDFVDMLFKRVEKDFPEGIIQPSDFPGEVFISFEGKDRSGARRLADNLRNDGVDVWLDENKFRGGDDVDEKIIKAIDRCPVFIPLISRNSKKIQANKGVEKYHVREWNWAYKNLKSGDKDKKVKIIPVVIDNTDWKYPAFKGIYHFNIPSGDRVGEYEKLKDQLKKIQQITQD